MSRTRVPNHKPVWELHTLAATPPSSLFSVASTTNLVGHNILTSFVDRHKNISFKNISIATEQVGVQFSQDITLPTGRSSEPIFSKTKEEAHTSKVVFLERLRRDLSIDASLNVCTLTVWSRKPLIRDRDVHPRNEVDGRLALALMKLRLVLIHLPIAIVIVRRRRCLVNHGGPNE